MTIRRPQDTRPASRARGGRFVPGEMFALSETHWRRLRTRARGEDGAATAEYAIATMAAVAFAGVLVVIMQSEEVREILTDLVRQALTYNG